jgi:hypothetical protein
MDSIEDFFLIQTFCILGNVCITDIPMNKLAYKISFTLTQKLRMVIRDSKACPVISNMVVLI